MRYSTKTQFFSQTKHSHIYIEQAQDLVNNKLLLLVANSDPRELK